MIVPLLLLLSLATVNLPLGGSISLLMLSIVTWKQSNRAELSLAFLLSGKTVAGYASFLIGLPFSSGKIISIAAIYILHKEISLFTILNEKKLISACLYSSIVLFLAYLHGPKTFTCAEKLLDILYNVIIYVIIFYYLFKLTNINIKNIALLTLVLSICYAYICINFELTKYITSIFESGTLRQALYSVNYINKYTNQSLFSYQTLGNSATLALIMFLASYNDNKFYKCEFYLFLFFFTTTIYLIFISGARQSSIILTISIITIIFSRKKSFLLKEISKIFIALIFIIFTSYALLFNENILTYLFHNDSFADILNRRANFEAALHIINKYPFFGVGLGGYYIPGLNLPGNHNLYAHNIFLELLTELGLVGTIAYLAAWLFPYLLVKQNNQSIAFLSTRTASGTIAIPLVMFFLSRSMISSNMAFSVGTFIIIYFLLTNKFVKQSNVKK